MRTPKGIQIEQIVDELTRAFQNYLHPLLDEWKRYEPIQIQEKIGCPLFTVYDDKTIGLNFAKEVIIYAILNYLLPYIYIYLISYIILFI